MDRSRKPFTRRDFLKTAGAAGAAAALLKGGRVFAQGEGPTGPEQQTYEDMLLKRFLVSEKTVIYPDGVTRDSLQTQFGTEAYQPIRNVVPGNEWRPTPEMVVDRLELELQEYATKTGEPFHPFDHAVVTQYIADEYGPGGEWITSHSITEPYFVQDEGGQWLLNVSDGMKNDLWKVSINVPHEVITNARLSEEQLQAQPQSAGAEQIGATPEPAGTGVPEGTPVFSGGQAPEAPPQTPAEREKSAKRLLVAFGGLFAAGASMLGFGWLFGRKPGAESQKIVRPGSLREIERPAPDHAGMDRLAKAAKDKLNAQDKGQLRNYKRPQR